MANENLKIVIKEVNETSPQGAGASSDIAYVPGLALDEITDASGSKVKSSRNVPILCNSISEFELHFGKTPYKFAANDVGDTVTYNKNKYKEGDYDPSYIYAKELINSGLSVYYENICVDSDAIDDRVEEIDAESASLDAAVEAVTTATTDVSEAETHLADAIDLKNKAEGDAAIKAATEVVLAANTQLEVAKQSLADAEIALKNTIAYFVDAYDITGVDTTDTDVVVFAIKNALTTEKTTLNETKTMSKIDYLYSVLSDRLSVLEDKDEYTVKYITTGGYPTFYNYVDHTQNTLADKLVDVAYNRGDAVALVDHANDSTLPLDAFNPRSIYSAVNKHNWAHGTFGAMFTPYGKYSCMTINDDLTTDAVESVQVLPASFGYLKCLASAIKNSPNWLAMAGVTRGQVPNLQELMPKQLLSNIIAEDYQPKFGGNEANKISMNAITTIKPYGLTLWGNRTLEKVDPKGTNALNFLNTRNMISDIKKLAHQTAKSLMFEQDSDALWLSFKTRVSPLLEQLKTGFGISDYQIVKATTKYDGEPLTKGELAAVIRIFPLYAVEYFDITVVISDSDN